MADVTIRALTNSPVNHVGMAVAIDDLPPLLWHAELGRSLPDVWTGERHRGVQLHSARRGGQDVEHALSAARLGPPARRPDRAQSRGPVDGGHRPLRRPAVSDHARASAAVAQPPRAPHLLAGGRSSARSSSPRPINTWVCWPPADRPARTTLGASGAATTSPSSRRSRWALRSRCGAVSPRGRSRGARETAASCANRDSQRPSGQTLATPGVPSNLKPGRRALARDEQHSSRPMPRTTAISTRNGTSGSGRCRMFWTVGGK